MEEFSRILLDLNKRFFSDARSVWVNRHGTNSWWPLERAPATIDLLEFTVLRSTEGRDGSLVFALDVDFATNTKRALGVGDKIEAKYGDSFNRKWSGNAGPHLCAHIPHQEIATLDLREYGTLQLFLESIQIGILENAGLKVYERLERPDLEDERLVCVNPHIRSTLAKRKGVVLPLVDRTLFQQGRRFRGFCRHQKTGGFSVPYEQGESWDEVSKRATLETPVIPEFDLPIFDLFDDNVGPVRPKPAMEDFKPEVHEITADYIIKADEAKSFTFCPGVALDLTGHLVGGGDGHHGPSHFARYITAAFCRYLKWSPDMVFRLFERLSLPDFDPARTAYYVGYEWKRSFFKLFYLPTWVVCDLVQREGFCVGHHCVLYREESSEEIEIGALKALEKVGEGLDAE